MRLQYGVSNLEVKDRLGRGQRVLQIISVATLEDSIRVPKAHTPGE